MEHFLLTGQSALQYTCATCSVRFLSSDWLLTESLSGIQSSQRNWYGNSFHLCRTSLNVYRHNNYTLRKHAYSNILKISPPKNENFQIKKILIFFIFQFKTEIVSTRYKPPKRVGSNEYPQSMFLRRNKKNTVCSYKPQFYYTKSGFKGVKIM